MAALAAMFWFVAPATAQTSTAPAATGSDRVLTIGRVSGNPRKHAARLQALADHVVARHEAFDSVEVVLKSRLNAMVEAARAGEIDIISETLFSAFALERDGGMEMRLVEWKGGVRAYHSVILVRRDSDYRSIRDLAGAKLVFEDPGSTSGFFLPYAELMDAGLNLVPEASRTADVSDVRYVFGGSEINVVASLARGRADAAAISNLDLDDDEVVTTRFAPQVRVLHETVSVPRSLTLVRAGLDDGAKSRLDEILTGLHTSPTGRKVLSSYFKVKQFDAFTDSDASEIAELRRLFEARHAR